MMLIKNGLLIDPSCNKEGKFDLLIENGLIKAVESPGSIKDSQAEEVVDATGKWVTPGLVDVHVHLRDPGQEWKETVETGAQAAALGGYTSICCMPNTIPSNHCAETTKYILEKARKAKASRVLPIGAVSIDLKGKEMAPLSELAEAGCVAFSDDGQPVYDAGLMRRALEWAGMLGLPISCHEEDKNLSCGGCMNESPLSNRLGLKGMAKIAEEVMVARDIELARTTKSHVHFCHISSGRGVELIRRAKNDGISVTAEVTPHHLVLTEEVVSDYDASVKMSPPLREEDERQALLEGICDGTLDAIASDHAPHESDVKEVEFGKAAFGILGLQTSLPLILEFVKAGTLSPLQAISLLSTAPAKSFGLPYGSLQKGQAADIAIIDPEYTWEFSKEHIQSLSFNSPFIGRSLQGVADTVIVAGRIVVRNRQLISEIVGGEKS